VTIRIIAASRSSRLALKQTEMVLDTLAKLNKYDNFQVLKINTAGDVDKRPIFSMDRKGVFEKEVNDSVLNGQADFGVHSLKDIPTDLHSELLIASVPRRADPRDVLVSKNKINLVNLTRGSKVGTSSLRRAVQIKRKNPGVEVIPIRGNVETRIKKSLDGSYDAIVLAQAGLSRLGLESTIVERFRIRDFLPAPGQGAMAIVCRRDNRSIISLLRKIEHLPSRLASDAERSLIKGIDTGCRFPVGALAKYDRESKNVHLTAKAFSIDGKKTLSVEKIGKGNRANEIGEATAQWFIKNGIEEIAYGWRDALNSWDKI